MHSSTLICTFNACELARYLGHLGRSAMQAGSSDMCAALPCCEHQSACPPSAPRALAPVAQQVKPRVVLTVPGCVAGSKGLYQLLQVHVGL